MVRVLVTGGAGFIGSHVVDELVGLGHEVVSLDLLYPGAHDGPPPYLREDVTNLREDVRDPEVVAAALAGVGAVCHQASMVGLGVDLDDIADYVSHNDVGTAVLLRGMHASGFRGPLVLASSMVVYGEGRYVCGDHGSVAPGPRAAADMEAGRFEPPCPICGRVLSPHEVTEDAPLDPRNVYAATKLHQEHLCASFAREHPDVSFAAMRYHNVYGPRMPRDTPYAGVASIFRSALERGDAPRVFEDGGQMRNFVHVSDVAHANVLAIGAGARGAFNIASPEPHTVSEMAVALASAFGADVPDPVVTGAYRLGDVRHVFASPEHARRELGFVAATGFAEGMAGFAHAPLRRST